MNRRAIFLLVLALSILSAYCLSAAAPVDQEARWTAAEVRKVDYIRADKLVTRFERTKSRYESVARADVSPAVLFCLHYREGDNDFTTHPHNGDSLSRRTVNVPRGRLPNSPPPYKWEQSAIDAYYTVDHLEKKDWLHMAGALDAIEGFNGFGYRRLNVPTPYLWSGTTIYTRGKYVADGRFNRFAVDKQLGVAAIMKRMQERRSARPFWFTPQYPPPTAPPDSP